MTLFFAAAGGLLFFYLLALLFLTAGVVRNRISGTKAGSLPSLSIVVCARNEAGVLPALLRALKEQTLPCEVVLVDDRSTDGTGELMRHYPGAVTLSLTQEEGTVQGKKRALTRGIEAAGGEVILLTDADCIPGPGWAQGMASLFSRETGVIAGGSLYEEEKWYHRLMNLEMLALAACSEGAMGWQQPLLATGNNLAYRRELFYRAGGFRGLERIETGDDDLMIQRMGRVGGGRFAFAWKPCHFVRTRAQSSFLSFIHQRARWASGVFHWGFPARLALGAVYLLYLLFFFSPLGFLIPGLGYTIIAGWGVTACVELLFLATALKGYGKLSALLWYFPARLLFVPYLLAMPLWAVVRGYRWKE
ncbi:MAG TPA: glycosyltransferase [Candidatus Mcinerneyibacteriales bacterium]|nr:glycosyltransferase [Candidatus Mcinerneyibacteriales bacterium]